TTVFTSAIKMKTKILENKVIFVCNFIELGPSSYNQHPALYESDESRNHGPVFAECNGCTHQLRSYLPYSHSPTLVQSADHGLTPAFYVSLNTPANQIHGA